MYRIDSTGKTRVRYSKVRQTQNDDGSIAADWIVKTGVLNGKLVEKRNTYLKGKGKRSAFEQACAEAQSKHDLKKKKEKYVESLDDVADAAEVALPAPMLASKYDPKKHPFPLYGQPKMDGNRCLARVTADGDITLWSRSGNVFEGLDHLKEPLFEIGMTAIKERGLDEFTFDGELFTWELPFKDLNGALKRQEKDPDTAKTDKARQKMIDHNTKTRAMKAKVQFWWYDIAMLGEEELVRIGIRNKLADAFHLKDGTVDLRANSDPVVSVPTKLLEHEESAQRFHMAQKEAGYEGTILRCAEGEYRFQARSKHLLKWKDFHDQEYVIIGMEENNKLPGTGKYVCKTDDCNEFRVMPKGSMEERAKMWQDFQANPDHFIGKKLTVEFFETFEDGIPRFPVGKSIRDEV